jgi:P27 family predicted phage terminase small subunit
MGKRGRKKVMGSVLRSERPICPPDLDNEGKKAFKSLCDDLADQGTLCKTDKKMILLYANKMSLYIKATKQLSEESLTTEANGRKYINPLVPHINILSRELRTLLSDCGLTPQTRKRQPLGTEDERLNDTDI